MKALNHRTFSVLKEAKTVYILTFRSKLSVTKLKERITPEKTNVA